MSCYKDNRESCGTVVSSSCVNYTGEIDLESLKDQCPINLNDVLEELLSLVAELQKGTDVKDLDLSCLAGSAFPSTLTSAELLKLLLDKICEILLEIEDLKAQVANPLTAVVTIDLSCFSDNPCYADKQEYTVFEIITILVSELCNLKTKYDVLLQSL